MTSRAWRHSTFVRRMVTSLAFRSSNPCAATMFNPLTSEIKRKRSSRSAPLKSNDSRLLLRGAFGMVGGAGAIGRSGGAADRGGRATIFGASLNGAGLGSGGGRLARGEGGGFFRSGGGTFGD